MKRGEIRKIRPAVIVSNDSANRNLNRLQVVPLTNKTERLYPSEAYVTVNAETSTVRNRIGLLSAEDMTDIERIIRVQLGLRQRELGAADLGEKPLIATDLLQCNTYRRRWRSVQTYRTHSEEETIALGESLARQFPPRAVVLLIGNLGAGKTTLAKGIVKGLGAASLDEVSSPTFTLIHEYGIGPAVYHIDLYRLDHAREVATLGLDELFEKQAVVLIEWGERFPQFMPAERMEIRLEQGEDEERIIRTVSLPRDSIRNSTTADQGV